MTETMIPIHRLLSLLALLATLAWGIRAVLAASRDERTMTSLTKGLYIAAMAITGLSALTGFALFHHWMTMVFPYIGILAVAIHGYAGVKAKTLLAAGGGTRVSIAVAVQVFVLVVSAYLMVIKPF